MAIKIYNTRIDEAINRTPGMELKIVYKYLIISTNQPPKNPTNIPNNKAKWSINKEISAPINKACSNTFLTVA
ncbi:hypothetical protein [Candidatus Coxiella mudrowiae]|uniref:hypothetical protein n=1 Tax=Candidatus Coxiella mudrowiae TaxID=2054173 RepID=UPI000C287FC0|nr:hypothetical protein [Candidatus Coxiella mudrowiae]